MDLEKCECKHCKAKIEKGEKAFVHSRCHNAHWELTLVDGHLDLECEVCGKPAGVKVSK